MLEKSSLFSSKYALVRMAVMILSGLICICFLSAQTEYEKWKSEYEKKFKEHVRKQDLAFSEFLLKEWKEFQAFRGIVPDTSPKPVNIPKAEPAKHLKFRYSPVVKTIKSIIGRDSVKKEIPTDLMPAGLNSHCTFPFFDTTLTISYDQNMVCKLRTPVSNKTISKYWEEIAASNFKPFIARLMQFRELMRLNDWGYLVLIENLSREIVSDTRTQPLFQWFVLIKTGFDVRIGYNNEQVYLLIASKHIIYRKAYWTINGRRYYLIDFRNRPTPGSLYIYEEQYPDVIQQISLSIDRTPSISGKTGKRILRFRYDTQEYQIPVEFDLDAIKFFNNYPQTEFPIYFSSSVSEKLEKSLINGLGPIIQGKSEALAVNIILRFVQTAFEYKRDDENFGEENYLFPEETVYYPYSDCEDRSILFTYLVRRLVGLEVIGLDYPGHIATAVLFHGDINGNSIEFNGKRYLVCDPTFINADIGRSMPQLVNVNPEIIVF